MFIFVLRGLLLRSLFVLALLLLGRRGHSDFIIGPALVAKRCEVVHIDNFYLTSMHISLNMVIHIYNLSGCCQSFFGQSVSQKHFSTFVGQTFRCKG